MSLVAFSGCQAGTDKSPNSSGFTGTLAGNDPEAVTVVKSGGKRVSVKSTDTTKGLILSTITAAGKCVTLRDIKAVSPSTDNAEVIASARDLEAQGKLKTSIIAPDIYFGLPEHGACA